MMTLFLLFFSSLYLQASETLPELAHPFVLLSPGQFTLETRGGLFLEEHEFEKAKVVEDLFEYEHDFYKIKTVIGFPGARLLSLELSMNGSGKLTKEYSPKINLPRQDISYKGFHAIETYFQQHFATDNSKNNLALEARFKGSPLKGKETNNTYQGKDVSLSFLYSHTHEERWRIYGDLHAEIIGKKKISKYDGEEEVISPYSQFGNLIGVQWLKGKFWVDLNGYFYLTTDYNSVSPSYTRLTDKGFVIGGKILLGYYITPAMTVTIDHNRQGANFNVITESTTEATEFEIETQYTQLGVTWLF